MALTRVDDRSSDITFLGGWGTGGAPSDYNNSVSYAQLAGQSATLSFRGTGIAVFGHIMRRSPGIPPPVSTYSIDGGSPTTYTEYQDDDEHNNQQFYQSPVLSNGQHTIVVTNVFDNHAAYFLDYFLVVAGNDSPPPPPPPPPPSPTVTTVVTPETTPSSSSTITDRSSSPSNTISASSLSRLGNLRVSTSMINGTIMTLVPVTNIPSSESVGSLRTSPSSTSRHATMASSAASTSPNLQIRTGIIVGTSIGGAVAFLLSAFVVYCCLRKRRRAESDWRMISGFANQPSSQWLQPVTPSGGIQSKKPPRRPQPTESLSPDHSTVSARPRPRPPSYSQEPPLYNPANASSIPGQNPQLSKFAGYLDP